MARKPGWRCCGWLAALLVAPAPAAGQAVALDREFVRTSRNRAVLQLHFTIDKAHKNPNPVSRNGEDGDLHMAGRSAEVGLPLVVEIVNAGKNPQKPARDFVRLNTGTDQAVPLAGAWRLWFEHPPAGLQVQNPNVPKPAGTNPDHVYEIHPVTQIGPVSILSSFVPIAGFEAYDADTAFSYYESLDLTVQSGPSRVLLGAKKAKYNYAEFRIELTRKPREIADGYTVMAKVLDLEGNPVATSGARRMVFVGGTAPAERVRNLTKGDRLHVLGIPRINLDLIWRFARDPVPPTVVKLPYEMIIVGVFPD